MTISNPSDATGGRLDRLTERQREALRLVARGIMTSKDIGRELGLSHFAVDARLRNAVRVLGVKSRWEAARLLADKEDGTYERTAYQPPHLSPAAAAVMVGDAAAGAGLDGETRTIHGDGRTGFPLSGDVAAPRPAFRAWGGRNDLSIPSRLLVIAMIAIGSALGFGAILSGLQALAALI